MSEKPAVIEYKDLIIKLWRHQKLGEYRYKSPRWGYKRAFKYNQYIRIYRKDNPDLCVHQHPFKDATQQEILRYVDEWLSTQEKRARVFHHRERTKDPYR